MNGYVQTGDWSFDFDKVQTPADYANADDTMQKLSRIKSVIDVFATRVYESKGEAYAKICQDGAGL